MEIQRIEPAKVFQNGGEDYIIDWEDIFRLYNELGCPDDVYNPSELPINDASWFVLTSERSTGKTNNLILIAIILFLRYGFISAYIRETQDMITPKEMQNFMNVILKFGYIEKMTGGKYNGARYWARHYRLVKWAEDGTKEEESAPFLWVGDLAENLTYKSVLNLSNCYFIIYDEFISKFSAPNTFVTLCDLHKTIGRNRLGIKMFLLANTTNYYHEFFRELLIQEEVLQCKVNCDFIKTTPLGTRVYYKMIGQKSKRRELVNTEYYGFKNPLLASITGGDWAVNCYPHIQRGERKTIDKCRYIRYNDRYYQIELVSSDRLGMHCLVHRANKPSEKDKYKIYTIDEIQERRESYKFGSSLIDAYLWNLRKKNKWYYADNDVGFSVDSYINYALKIK